MITDYRNSYVLNSSVVDGEPCNTCRTQLLAGCRLIDGTGREQDYYLGTACIGEHMYMEGGIAQIPTCEVCIIFGDSNYKLIKKFAEHRTDLVQVAHPGDPVRLFDGRTASWTDLRFERRTVEAQPLNTIDAIIGAIEGCRPIVAQTAITDEQGASRAILEYPVSYTNYRPDRKAIQVDAGPMLFAGVVGDIANCIEAIQLAYVMYRDLDRAEFAIRMPTDIGQDRSVQTLHYSKIVQTEAVTTIYELES